MENKTIKTLRFFFKTTNAAFAVAKAAHELADTGEPYEGQAMADIHEAALIEIEKDEPNMLKIDLYLRQMEMMAEAFGAMNKTTFKEGGITGSKT